MLVDVFRKQPIHDAVILCNGRQNPYIKKDDGYYIFCDVPPGSYKIDIFSPGYVRKSFFSTIEFGECKRFIFEMSFKSKSYIISETSRIEFSLTKNNEKLRETNFRIILKNPIVFLKLIRNARQNDNEILLNVQNNNYFLMQNYIYEFNPNDLKKESDGKDDEESDESKSEEGEENDDNSDDEKLDDESKSDEEKSYDDKDSQNDSDSEDKESDDKDDEESDESKSEEDEENNDNSDDEKLDDESKSDEEKSSDDKDSQNDDEKNNDTKNVGDIGKEEMFFIGYDMEYSAYILLKGISQDLPMGGKFYPFWNLSTDKNGKFILPFFGKFMNQDFLDFEVQIENESKTVKIDTRKIDNHNLLSSKVKFD